MKHKFKLLFILLVISLLFRSFIFNICIKYADIGERTNVEISNLKILKKIEKQSNALKGPIDLNEVVSIASTLTSQELSFTFQKTSNDPNILIESRRANCVGYASMFNSIINYLIIENGLEEKIEASHHVGKLYCFGFDLHSIPSKAFFKDHDFNLIKNLETGEEVAIDPSVNDYLKIDKVSLRGEI